MTERHDNHQQYFVMHGVDDAVVAHTHSQAGAALQRLGLWRARVLARQCDRAADPVAALMVDPLQRASR